MVITMTLIIVCALFAITGGLAFYEVTSLRSELQTQRLLNDKAMSHIGEYCDRLAWERSDKETYQRLHKAAIDHNQVLSRNLMKAGNRNSEALNRITVLEYQLQSIKDTLPDWAGGTVIDDKDVE